MQFLNVKINWIDRKDGKAASPINTFQNKLAFVSPSCGYIIIILHDIQTPLFVALSRKSPPSVTLASELITPVIGAGFHVWKMALNLN